MQRDGSSCRIAVDVGGTFTDVVLESGGRHYTAKVLTTYADPVQAVMAGLEQVMALGKRPLADAEILLHGTTLATNALIQRTGAVTALITTDGHRDAVEMAYENRFEQYDIDIDRPQPLTPRRLRFVVRERMNAQGEVLVPLDESSVEALVPALSEHGVTSVAVGLLHAYANPVHERRIARILEERLPDLSVTLASEVCPEIREFERLSTACANAYVKPLMSRYLNRFAAELAARGFNCPFLLMTSGGGLTDVDTAARFPIRLVESGPAGGAILAGRMAEERGLDRVLSFDMGGTTAKICLIDDCAPQLSRSFEVDRSYRFKKGSGLPVRIPVIEMVEIGAGGGSIASVDTLARIRVGPESAGSEPGPACYGRGGRNPTVTDADAIMGRLDEGRFGGGAMTLDIEAAAAAVDGRVGNTLRMDTVTAAFGIGEIVDENMAAAARSHAAEWGKPLADRVLIAYGGAAPQHAAQVALKLGLHNVVIPLGAGVGSAIGMLAAPVSYEVVRSRYMRLSEFDASLIEEVSADMRAEARAVVGSATSAPLAETRRAYMRYVGQGYEIAVVLPDATNRAEVLLEAFESAYRQLYGRTIPDLDVEVLSWTLALGSAAPAFQFVPGEDAGDLGIAPRGPMYDPVLNDTVTAPRFARETLAPGAVVEGPAMIVEAQTTTVVVSTFTATVSPEGDILMARAEV
ncbi:MAG: hydantoinase/oxoprolinase family protein [Gammaproteobacteria bacterium]|nr:hydantoinase/oxoprolinase family protein [Gammaproteobacteria bacterium]